MYPEKVTYNEKYNLRPIIEPDGQFSAEDANHLKEKVNKNALFHDVHDNLAALQAAFPNPPKGAFAYLKDGSCYRCVGIGWTTDGNGSGEGSSYFYGYHTSLPLLKAAHPKAKPGARAIIKVKNGNDLEALWDEDDQDWFDFQLSGQSTGNPTETFNGFTIESFSNGYQGGLTWKPFAKFSFAGNSFSATATLTPTTADIPQGEQKFAAIVLNSNGTISLAQGDPAVNPSAPNIDIATQVIPDGGLILLSSGAAAPDGVTLQKIYTNNSGIAGGEWDVSVFRGGARWNLAFDDNGNTCIKGTALQGDDVLKLNAPAAIPIGSFTELTFKIRNIDMDPANGETGGFAFSATGTVIDSKGRAVSNTIMLPRLKTTSYDVTNTTDWQFISIKIPALNFIDITGLSFNFDPANPVPPTILLDDIKYNDGSAPAGENFATVGYVERRVSETLQAAKDFHNENSGGDISQEEFDAALLLKVDKVAGKGLSTEDYSTAEKNKLAAIDAAHYGQPLQSLAELTAIPEAEASDKERRYIEDELSDYFYDAQLAVASENTVAPDDQTNGTGFWRKVAVGGDTAVAVMTKYESNPDRNPFTDALRDKLNSITAIFTTSLKTAYDAAASWVTTNGQNVLDRLGVLERLPITVASSRMLAATDHKRKLCITAPGVTLTYPAAGLGEGFEFNAVTNASGTLTLADQNSGNDIDGLTFLPEGSMGHAFKWPAGLLTTKGDWE